MTGSKAAGDFFVSGGTLSPDSASYIERDSDALLVDALKRGRYCYILNSRQMGKSSLSVRTIAKLETQGIRTAFVDLTQIGGRNVTPDQWYMGLCSELGRSLGVRAELLTYCKEHLDMAPMQRFFGGLRDVVMQKVEGPLVIFIDEIDATKNLSFNTDEFFAGIRECFNRRVRDESLQRLTFCLLGVAVPSDLISNPATTPFNIGERIHLQDFTLQELQRFAPALGTNGDALIERIHHWTNGQPFLTQSLCQTVAVRGLQDTADVDQIVFEQFFGPKARDTNINLADVANRALNGGANEVDPERFRSDLLSMYERAWKGGNVKDDEANRVAVVLKLSGLLRTDGSRLRVRNRIYERVFDQQWVRDSMPDQELRRQEQSFRRGLLRGVASATAIIATVSILGLIAWRSRQEAVAAQSRLDYELYVSDMGSMRFFEETGDIARMELVLDRTRNSSHRGFEWAFWNGRLHDAPEEYTLDYTAPGKREDGIVSRDGASICVLDALLGTATLVDRKTKGILAARRIGGDDSVVSTSRGFVVVNPKDEDVTVVNLLTGRPLYRIGQGPHLHSISTRRYSDCALMPIEDHAGGATIEWQMWNLATGRQLWRRPPPGERATEIAFSDDGSRLFYVTNASDAPQGVVTNATDGAVIDRFPWPMRSAVYQFSSSGKRILYRQGDVAMVARDTVSKRDLFRRELKDTIVPTSAQFTRDDHYVLCLYGTGQAAVYEADTGQLVSTRNNAWNVGTAGDNRSLIVASSTVRIVPRLENAGARVLGQGVRIARDGSGAFRAYREDHKQILVLHDPDLRVLAQKTVDPTTYSSTYNGRWAMHRTQGTPRAVLIESVDGGAKPLHVAPTSTNFAAGISGEIFAVLNGANNALSGVEGQTGKTLWEKVVASGVRGMWITPDSRLLLVLATDTQLEVMDPRTGGHIANLDAHNVRLTNVTFPNPNVFFTCGADGRAILWDAKTLKIIQEFKGNAAQRISGADLSPDGKRVATCNYAGSWQIWDAETGAQLMGIQASPRALRGIVFTADGKSVVTTGEDNQVKAWTTLALDPSVKLPVPPEYSKGIKP